MITIDLRSSSFRLTMCQRRPKQRAAFPCRRAFRFGLSARPLLWLTIAFIMLAEILIFVPSVANFRKNWLHGAADRRTDRFARGAGRGK